MAKVKYKERLLKAASEKQVGNCRKAISWLFSRNSAGQTGVAWYIQSDEKKKPTTKNILAGKASIQIWRKGKEFYRHAKAKRVQQHH